MPYKSREKRRAYHRKYNKRWHKMHPEMQPLYTRRWYKRNRVQKLAQTVIQNRKRYHRNKLLALQKYGGTPPKCACCSEQIYEFLTIDHVNGDGGKHRKALNSYTGGLYGWLVKTRKKPAQFRVLCMNCNMATHHYGVCPHQRSG